MANCHGAYALPPPSMIRPAGHARAPSPQPPSPTSRGSPRPRRTGEKSSSRPPTRPQRSPSGTSPTSGRLDDAYVQNLRNQHMRESSAPNEHSSSRGQRPTSPASSLTSTGQVPSSPSSCYSTTPTSISGSTKSHHLRGVASSTSMSTPSAKPVEIRRHSRSLRDSSSGRSSGPVQIRDIFQEEEPIDRTPVSPGLLTEKQLAHPFASRLAITRPPAITFSNDALRPLADAIQGGISSRTSSPGPTPPLTSSVRRGNDSPASIESVYTPTDDGFPDDMDLSTRRGMVLSMDGLLDQRPSCVSDGPMGDLDFPSPPLSPVAKKIPGTGPFFALPAPWSPPSSGELRTPNRASELVLNSASGPPGRAVQPSVPQTPREREDSVFSIATSHGPLSQQQARFMPSHAISLFFPEDPPSPRDDPFSPRYSDFPVTERGSVSTIGSRLSMPSHPYSSEYLRDSTQTVSTIPPRLPPAFPESVRSSASTVGGFIGSSSHRPRLRPSRSHLALSIVPEVSPSPTPATAAMPLPQQLQENAPVVAVSVALPPQTPPRKLYDPSATRSHRKDRRPRHPPAVEVVNTPTSEGNFRHGILANELISVYSDYTNGRLPGQVYEPVPEVPASVLEVHTPASNVRAPAPVVRAPLPEVCVSEEHICDKPLPPIPLLPTTPRNASNEKEKKREEMLKPDQCEPRTSAESTRRDHIALEEWGEKARPASPMQRRPTVKGPTDLRHTAPPVGMHNHALCPSCAKPLMNGSPAKQNNLISSLPTGPSIEEKVVKDRKEPESYKTEEDYSLAGRSKLSPKLRPTVPLSEETDSSDKGQTDLPDPSSLARRRHRSTSDPVPYRPRSSMVITTPLQPYTSEDIPVPHVPSIAEACNRLATSYEAKQMGLNEVPPVKVQKMLGIMGYAQVDLKRLDSQESGISKRSRMCNTRTSSEETRAPTPKTPTPSPISKLVHGLVRKRSDNRHPIGGIFKLGSSSCPTGPPPTDASQFPPETPIKHRVDSYTPLSLQRREGATLHDGTPPGVPPKRLLRGPFPPTASRGSSHRSPTPDAAKGHALKPVRSFFALGRRSHDEQTHPPVPSSTVPSPPAGLV